MNIKKINFKNMDKRMITYLGIGIGSIVLLIIILFILKIIVGNRIDSKQLENKMKNAAIEYYKKYPDKLPSTSGNSVSISIDELVEAGNLKSLDKLLDKGLTCEGKVNVSNNNGFYLYQPNIKCSDNYETNSLYKRILNDNSIVTTGNGLYKMNDYYLFRGENLNNYVKFANMNWQILRINSDNTIRLILVDDLDTVIWDDRYNVDTNDSVGKNDYSISRIKDTLNNYFNGKTFNDENKALIVPQSLCIGYRNENSTLNDGSIECSKKLDNQPIGLLQVNEYMLASLEPTCKNISDNQCRNYNFLAKYNSYWTLTANSANSYEVYKISGTLNSYLTYTYAQPKFVITLSSDALYKSGTGTQSDPYTLK
jgi:hypothetical protein